MVAFKGITFFDLNYALEIFKGTVTVSSNDLKKWLVFDNNKNTRWISSGEDTDGNAIEIERDFEVNRLVNSFFIYNTNISDIALEYYDGSWHSIIHETNATITKSENNKHIFILMDSNITISKIKITGSNTLIANNEKFIYKVFAFKKIGTLEYPISIANKQNVNEKIFTKEDSKGIVINRGNNWEFALSIKSHINQNDIDILKSLEYLEHTFHIWINSGNEPQFTYKFEPYRFQDIYQVSKIRGSRARLTNNMYWGGLNDTLILLEVS